MKLLVATAAAVALFVAVPSDCRRQPRPEHKLKNSLTSLVEERPIPPRQPGPADNQTNILNHRQSHITEQKCRSGFEVSGNYCLHFSGINYSDWFNYTEAVDYCHNLSATLAFPPPEHLDSWQAAVIETLDPLPDGYFAWVGATFSNDTSAWHWIDYSEVPIGAWSAGEPDDVPDWSYAAVFSTGLLYNFALESLTPALCQASTTTTKAPTITTTTKAPTTTTTTKAPTTTTKLLTQLPTTEKPECKNSKKCTNRGGLCGRYTNETDCRGTLLSTGFGCKGRKCQCCTPECPLERGFFIAPGTKQCMKFYGNKQRTWVESNKLCENEGLRMSKPYDPVALRSYMVGRYGPDARCFLGARGNGRTFVWNDGRELSRDNPWWFTGAPSSVSSDMCLELYAEDGEMAEELGRPYWATECISLKYTLCELVLLY